MGEGGAPLFNYVDRRTNMKRETRGFSLLVVTLILVSQLVTFAPVAQAIQGENRNRTYSMRADPPAKPAKQVARSRAINRAINQGGTQYRCYRRCRREYSRCLYWAGGNRGRRRACAIRYRNCLRRCG
jgi:hypothetical protein